MKFLNKKYSQSEELDLFNSEALGRFKTYYKVTTSRKELDTDVSYDYQEELFSDETEARKYYDQLLKDVKEYNWYRTEVNLYEVSVSINHEELESQIVNSDVDEEEPDLEEPIDFDDSIEEVQPDDTMEGE